MRVTYRKALIKVSTKELLELIQVLVWGWISGVDTKGLQSCWRCSTLFLAAITGVGRPVATSGRLEASTVELGMVA